MALMYVSKIEIKSWALKFQWPDRTQKNVIYGMSSGLNLNEKDSYRRSLFVVDKVDVPGAPWRRGRS